MGDALKTVSRACPLCNTPSEKAGHLHYGSEEWPMVECPSCTFVYLPRVPVYERLSEEFAWEKTSEAEREVKIKREPGKQKFSAMFKRFRQQYLKRNKLPVLIQHYVHPGNVLDIGCAAGGLLASLPDIYAPHGVEISKALAEQANAAVKPRGGYVVHDNAVNGTGQFSENYFSGVIMSAFLEHEAQPVELLRNVARALRADGVAIIKVPNYASVNRKVRSGKWCGFRLPDHVNYFTPTTLRKTVEKAGLKVRKFTFADQVPTSDNMWMVVGR